MRNGWSFHRQRWRKSIIGKEHDRGEGMEAGKWRMCLENREYLDPVGQCVRYMLEIRAWAGAITNLYSI